MSPMTGRGPRIVKSGSVMEEAWRAAIRGLAKTELSRTEDTAAWVTRILMPVFEVLWERV
jgi:hypothetical protein